MKEVDRRQNRQVNFYLRKKGDLNMLRLKSLFIVFCVLVLSVMIPKISMAEWFLDVYGGESTTRDANVNVEVTDYSIFGSSSQSHTEKVDFDASFTMGVGSATGPRNFHGSGSHLICLISKQKAKGLNLTSSRKEPCSPGSQQHREDHPHFRKGGHALQGLIGRREYFD